MAWFDEFNLPGVTVDGYFGFIRADGPDEDDYPDVTLANGWVTFKATTPAARVDGAWLGIEEVRAQIFEGRIVVSEEDPRPVRLLATNAPIGVADWAWTATFDLTGLQLAPLTFKAPRDTTVNLTADLIPIKSQPYQIIEGASIVDAEVDDAGRMRFELSDGTYTRWVDVPNGEKGDPGEPGEKGDPGADGTAATLAMGTVTAGTTADAWMTGTPQDRELNLTLPRGVKGDPGESWHQRTVAANEDILTLSPGIYSLTATAVWSAVNVPQRVVGVIVVEGLPGAVDKSIRFMPRGMSYFWENRKNGTSTWQGWGQVSTVDRAARGIIPNNTDIDSMRGTSWVGAWNTPGAGGENLATLTGTWPPVEGASNGPVQGIVEVGGTLGNLGDLGYQRISVIATQWYEAQLWTRFNQGYNTTGPEAWTPWVRLDAPDLSGDVDALDGRVTALEATSGDGIPTNALAVGGREMRMQLFRDAYPLVSTGGKGAVVFRYDHGLTNFKDVLLPLHQQYNLPAYIAMNSRNWGLAENSGATQAEAKTWSNVEWGNHTADHNDKTGINDIYEAVALGRIELEEQVGKTVHGFTVPGLPGSDGNSYEKLDGFNVGYPAGFSNSYAGSLILNHHAIASGVIGPQFRPLDGVIRQGGRHYGWENRAWDGTEGIKALIDQAISTKTALTLMMHPRTMGLPGGYWTPALADQVLAYVRQQIDAGNLANISYYQSHHAQLAPLPTPTYASGRRDVSGELLNGWTGSLFVERDGADVYFRGTLNGSAATSDIAWMLPDGFRPGFVQTPGGLIDYGAGIAVINDATSGVYQINHYSNRFEIRGAKGQAKNIGINHHFRTTNTTPTTHPGVPA